MSLVFCQFEIKSVFFKILFYQTKADKIGEQFTRLFPIDLR